MKGFNQIMKATKKSTIIFSVLVAVLLVGTSFGIKTQRAGALLGFGGQILSTTPCTCSGGAALAAVVVGPPVGGVYVQTAGTLMHAYLPIPYSPTGVWAGPTWLSVSPPGPWILGSYIPTPTPICSYYVGEDCLQFPSDGAMVSVGTSLMSTPL